MPYVIQPNSEVELKNIRWTVTSPNGTICSITDKLTTEVIESFMSLNGTPQANPYDPEISDLKSYTFGWDISIAVDWNDEFTEDLLSKLHEKYNSDSTGFDKLNIKSNDNSDEIYEKIKSGFNEDKISYNIVKSVVTDKYPTYNGMVAVEQAYTYINSKSSEEILEKIKLSLGIEIGIGIVSISTLPRFGKLDPSVIKPKFSLNHYRNPFYKMFHSDKKSFITTFYSQEQEYFHNHFAFPISTVYTDILLTSTLPLFISEDIIDSIDEIIASLEKHKIEPNLKGVAATSVSFLALFSHILLGITTLIEFVGDYTSVKSFINDSISSIVSQLKSIQDNTFSLTSFIKMILRLLEETYSILPKISLFDGCGSTIELNVFVEKIKTEGQAVG